MKLNCLRMNDFFKFVEELREYDGFKTTIKESIFRYCRENPMKDHGKVYVSETCYSKIVNKKGRIFIAFDYVVNKYNLRYSLENDNTIFFLKGTFKVPYT